MSDLGFCGDGPGCVEILEGRYDTSPYEENVKLLIQHLQQVHDVSTYPNYPTISWAEFNGKLKVRNENTTTSPPDLHLGYYMALIARHQYADDESDADCVDTAGNQAQSKKDEWDCMQRELRIFHLTLIN